jgi:hypothetical protein
MDYMMGYKENQARTVRNFSVPMIVWDMLGCAGAGAFMAGVVLLGICLGSY